MSTITQVTSGGYGAELATLAAFGGPEATIAQASLALEEQDAQAKKLRELSHQAEVEAAKKRIEEMRHAATSSLIAGIIGSVAQAGGAIGGQFSTELCKEAISSGGKVLSAAMDYDAGMAKQAIEEYDLLKDQAAKQSEELQSDSERAARLADKALSHVEQIAEARSQARLAAARG